MSPVTATLTPMASHCYPIPDRPMVEVLVGDQWRAGELWSWRDTPTGRVCVVLWSAGVGQNHIDIVGAERVRLSVDDGTLAR